MKIHLLAFGKLKTPGLREAASYYQKLLGPWAPLIETELKPLPVPDKSPATRARIQERESRALFEILDERISPRGAVYLMDESGQALSTREWAGLVRDWESGSVPEVALCIGSSLGHGAEARARARGRFSLGPETLSHELARVVLCEQLYRAWSVTRGHPYHNAD